MADWSKLPYDLILSIASRFQEFEDGLSLSSVCRSWRPFINKDWRQGRQNPWLMITEFDKHDVPRQFFFCISTLECYRYGLSLPGACGCKYWGTYNGWIVLFHQESAMHLVNPITRACINFPPLSMLKKVENHSSAESTNSISAIHETIALKLQDSFVKNHLSAESTDWIATIQKAIVLKLGDNFVTVITYKLHRCLAFCKIGDSKWTDVPFSAASNIQDVVCFKDQILAVTTVGALLLLKIDGPDSPKVFFVASPPEDANHWARTYLVESRDNLLLVCHSE